MQVQVEDLSSVRKKLHIEIPEDEVTREIDDAYKELKKTANIKGFRKGKVPRGLLEKRFQQDVNADVSSRLIQTSFADAIEQTELNIIGSPQLDELPDLEYRQPYRYEAIVEVAPDLSDVSVTGMKLEKKVYQVSDEEVENQLNMIQKNLANMVPIEEERTAREGDHVLIDYEGFKDGESFEPLQRTEGFGLQIGKKQMMPEVDEALDGMAPGEVRDVEISFPEDHPDPKLAGETITLRVELKEIRKEILPEINDDLAKQLGSFESLEELKSEIVNNLRQGYDRQSEQELREEVFSHLLEQQSFEVPETMVGFELENIIREMEQTFSHHNMTMEQFGYTREVLAEKYRDVAVKQVKRHLLLSKVIEQEKLELTEEEMEAGLAEMAASVQQPVEAVRQYFLANQAQLESFQHSRLEKKAIDLILKNSDIEEVEVTPAQENGSEDSEEPVEEISPQTE